MITISAPYQADRFYFHNRLMLPPIVTNMAEANGMVSDNLLEYYEKLTKGGFFSAAIIENAYISADGKFDRRQLSVADDTMIEGLARLAETIQRNGTKSILQINHAGNRAEAAGGKLPIGPTNIIASNGQLRARAVTREEIADMISRYQAAALRAKKAGFDGIEIHSAHGFLLNQFFSPLINQRTDEYGGSVQNRFRIHIEIIKAIRDTTDRDFMISLRLGACDYMEGGTTIDDSVTAARELEYAGVDLLSISGGLCGFMIPGGDNAQGYFSPLSSAIKKVVSIPVLLTGGITEASAANNLIAEQKADFVGIGRAILKDRDWAKHALEGSK